MELNIRLFVMETSDDAECRFYMKSELSWLSNPRCLQRFYQGPVAMTIRCQTETGLILLVNLRIFPYHSTSYVKYLCKSVRGLIDINKNLETLGKFSLDELKTV